MPTPSTSLMTQILIINLNSKPAFKPKKFTVSIGCRLTNRLFGHKCHHHHLSRSCHCWQMASTTHAMHFDFGPLLSIDCYQHPQCCLSTFLCVSPLLVFLLWMSILILSWPTWCCSFYLHVLPAVLSCTAFALLYLSPSFTSYYSFRILSPFLMFNSNLSMLR